MQVDWLERWYLRSLYSSMPRGGLDGDLGGVGEHDLAGVARERDLAGVERGAALHARSDVGRGRVDERHGLALHVGAHEGTLGVVVLEERDERGGDRDHLAGRDVHVVDVVHGHVGRDAEGAVEVARAGGDGVGAHQVALGVGDHEHRRSRGRRGGGRRDDVVLLLVGGHPVDLIGHVAVLDATVRGLDEAVLVHAGVERQADR